MKRSNRGFTLVELIIVIAVIGVLAAILIPTFANVIDKSNAKSAYSDAKNVVTDLIADYTEKTTDFPNLLIFSVKGKKLYAFGYDPEIGQVLEYKDNPIKSYDPNGAELKDQVDTIIEELRGQGALQVINESTLPEIFRFDGPNGLYQAIIRNSFDPEILCVRADTLIQSLVFFGADQQQAQGGGSTPSEPDEPVENIVTVTPTYDSATDAFVCTIPAGTPADAKIVLDMSGLTDKLKDDNVFNVPGTFGGYGITINDESGHNFAITSASFKSDMITALQDHDLTKAQELGLVDEAKPLITKSTKFTEYMAKLNNDYGIGDGSTSASNVQVYLDKYNMSDLPLTYTAFLKSCYGGSLDNVSLIDMISCQDASSMGFTAYYDSGVGEGIASGTVIGSGLRHVEPEVIALILDNLYDQAVTMSFLEENSSAMWQKYIYRICYGSYGFYDYMGDDWKTHYSGMNFNSLYDLTARNSYPSGLNFTVTDNGSSRTISGAVMVSWHQGTATNAYQSTIIDGVPNFSITLEAQG